MKKCLLYILFFFTVMKLSAQSNASMDSTRLKDPNCPAWIKMMNDPNANYYEAVASFKEYWKGKQNPMELLEGNEKLERSGFSRLFKTDKKAMEEATRYALEYKTFKIWMFQNEGFVKPDGRVMTPEEKQALVQQELQNRQNSIK